MEVLSLLGILLVLLLVLLILVLIFLLLLFELCESQVFAGIHVVGLHAERAFVHSNGTVVLLVVECHVSEIVKRLLCNFGVVLLSVGNELLEESAGLHARVVL